MEVFGQDILNLLSQYGYFAVFFTMMVSGPLVVVAGGFLASIGILNPWYIWALAIIVDLITDTFYYELGRRQGKRVLIRLGRFFHWPEKLAGNIEWLFGAHGGKTVFMAKMSHGLGAITQTSAGIARMPRPEFYKYSIAAALVRNTAFIFIGMLSGDAWQKWTNRIEGFAIGIALLLIAFVAGLLIANRMKESVKRGKDADDAHI